MKNSHLIPSLLATCAFGLVSAGFLTQANAAEGDAYTWPGYRNDLDYDTRSNIGEIKPPTKFNNNCSGVTGKKVGKWWAIYWGDKRDSRITDVTIDSILKKYDTDFGYLYDTLGWAPDAQAQAGQYSAIYYLGSGTCAGEADYDSNVGEYVGGYQSWVAGYTAVAASFYPLYSFNTSCPFRDRVAQMDAMIHEGIHSMTNGYPGAKEAHWFQEAGNTWIQQDMFSHRNAVYSGMGFLNAATVIAPFMPIECYSGWLTDGSFGGPGAQGVNNNWRYLIGGSQYSNIFPTFMGTWLGTGSVRWIYGHAYGKTKYLLETYGTSAGLGDEGTRRLIMEFRARLAMLDMKEWSKEIKNLLNQNFGGNSYDEVNRNSKYDWKMTPYQKMTESNGWLVPDAATTPGWSGANIVPLKVQSGATQVSVTMKALGKNMSLQLAYRATDGTPVYSVPMQTQNANDEVTAVLNLNKTPGTSNGSQMVFAIVCNTDYQFTGNENIRKEHFNYNLKLNKGLSGAGDAYTKWYNDFKLDYAWPTLEESQSISSSSNGGTASSSSSVVAGSSSSQEPASSSSVEVVGKTTTITVNVTLPIDDNYAGVDFDLQLASAAKALGVSENEIASKATYFAMDGNVENTNSTANDPGHWFAGDGTVAAYTDTDAIVYSEFSIATGKATVGHYPNRVQNGETYSFTQGLKYNGNKVLYKVTVTLTNESSGSSTEGTTPLNYGLDKNPASHLSLYSNGGRLIVAYKLDRADNAKVSLYTAYGALIGSSITGIQSAGSHTMTLDLDAMGAPRGTYIIKVVTGSYREARSISVAK